MPVPVNVIFYVKSPKLSNFFLSNLLSLLLLPGPPRCMLGNMADANAPKRWGVVMKIEENTNYDKPSI